jgi:hypothetical protein
MVVRAIGRPKVNFGAFEMNWKSDTIGNAEVRFWSKQCETPAKSGQEDEEEFGIRSWEKSKKDNNKGNIRMKDKIWTGRVCESSCMLN